MDDQDARNVDGRDLHEQRDRLEKALVDGWMSPARGPLIFSEDQLARIDRVREHGGLLNKEEHDYAEMLRAGGRRGDPLPAAPASREPFITGVGEDFAVRIVKTSEHANVVILFSHER